MKRKPVATTKRKGPTAAADVGAPVTSSSEGVRSVPIFAPWDNKAAETLGKIRDRVKKSRAIQEALPFVRYMTEAIPEEALSGGLTPKSASKTPEFKKDANDLFWAWADSTAIDLRKRFNFYSMQAQLGTTALGDGEVFCQKVIDDRTEAKAWALSRSDRRRLQIQCFTRDQIGSGQDSRLGALGAQTVAGGGAVPRERWIDGLFFNELDQLQKLRIITRGRPGYVERDAAVMMQIFADRRLNQFHGDPWLFSAENDALGALDMAALRKHAAIIRTAFLGAINTKDGEVPASMKAFMSRGSDNADGSGDNKLRYFNLYGGNVLLPLKTDEKVDFYKAGEAMDFGSFIEDLLYNIVYAFKYPPEYLIGLGKNGSATNRLLLGKVKKAHARIRKMIQTHFVQPVWEFVIGDAMAPGMPLAKYAGKVPDWNRITCTSEPDPSIDLGRDEKAEDRRIQNFTSTIESYCDSRGEDGTAIRHARLEEIADSISFGASIKKPGVEKGLPWFLCIDPMTLQSITALAQSGLVTLDDLQAATAQMSGSGN